MICLLAIPSQNWGTLAQKYFPKAVSDAPIELVAYQKQVAADQQAERENRAAQAARSQKENDERNERNRLETNRKNAEENARVAERNKRNAAEKANEASKSETKTKPYVAQYKSCSSCHGTGKKTCTYCGGQGRIYKTTARGSRESNYCTACSGGHKTCLGCSGSGKVKTH